MLEYLNSIQVMQCVGGGNGLDSGWVLQDSLGDPLNSFMISYPDPISCHIWILVSDYSMSTFLFNYLKFY